MHSLARILSRSAARSAIARCSHPLLVLPLAHGSMTPTLPLGSRAYSGSTSSPTSTPSILTTAHSHLHHTLPSPPPLYNLTPTDLTSLLFDAIHSDILPLLSLPSSWPVSIALTALFLRTSLTLPLAWYAHKTALRMHAVRPLARAWSHSIAHQLRSQSHAHGWGFAQFQEQYKKQYAEALGKLYLDNGIRPLFSLLAPIAQVPVWIAASVGLRRVCDPSLDKAGELARIGLENVPVELANSAFLWAPSLVVPDPSWIGPVVLAGLHLVNVQLALRGRGGGEAPPAVPTPVTGGLGLQENNDKRPWDRQRAMVWGMRGLAVAMIPVAKTVPFALVVYWATSAGFSLVQNVAFKVILAPAHEQGQDALQSIATKKQEQ